MRSTKEGWYVIDGWLSVRVHKMKSNDSTVKDVLSTLGKVVDDGAAHVAAGNSSVVGPAIEIRP